MSELQIGIVGCGDVAPALPAGAGRSRRDRPDRLEAMLGAGGLDGTSAADERWTAVEIPADDVGVVEHARHVLDIIVGAYAKIEDGRTHDTRTTF